MDYYDKSDVKYKKINVVIATFIEANTVIICNNVINRRIVITCYN